MERRSFATVKRVWPEPAIAISSPPLSFDEYMEGSVVDRETVISIMAGDLQRIRVYGMPPHNFQIPQSIPQHVWSAYEALVAHGHTMNIIPDMELEWEPAWEWSDKEK